MSRVRLAGVGRSFGPHRVLAGVDLDIADGEIMGVLGPSGCGKTTMLRIIAGFLAPDEGELLFDSTPVAGLSPQRRRVGYVPQEGALFPHLDVRGNILFGLPRRERTDDRAAELLDLADLDPVLLRSLPHQLSGGQQQRVALARALAPRPRVVLLDEPFSSLDASLRVSAGRAVTRVLRAAGTTAVLVTHDQGEALSLTDRVAVLRQGRVAQVDSPVELYRSPVDVGVATFVGGVAALPGRRLGSRVRCALGDLVAQAPTAGRNGSDAEQEVTALVRPEQIRLVVDRSGISPVGGAPHEAGRRAGGCTDVGGAGADADVEAVDFYGSYATVRLVLADGTPLVARVAADALPRPGERVRLEVVGSVGVSP